MIGKTIAHYKIIEKLGEGGMGVVYKAEDTKLDRKVAIKFLPEHLTKDKENVERFEREAKAAAALNHPNIITIHEISEIDSQIFIVMEFVDGASLRTKIDEKNLTIEEVLNITNQICEGLSEAHKADIVHRDIKPENILINNRGGVKILDFGLAKLKGVSKLTKETSTLGTIHYMSPEQLQGKEVDHKSDIWSLGVVLYELLTSQLPFRGEYESAIIYSILNEKPDHIYRYRKDITQEIDQIIIEALQKDRASRYSSINELCKDLNKYQSRFISSVAELEKQKRLLRRIRRPKLAITVTVIVLLLSLILVWLLNRREKIRWAKEEAIPEITRGDQSAAYNLACEAEQYIPNDSVLIKLLSNVSWYTSIHTNPPDADVYRKVYTNYADEWEFIGKTPIDSIRLPVAYYRWKIEKTGFETVTFTNKVVDTLYMVLDKKGSIPNGMIRVLGDSIGAIGKFEDFFIDRYEITNKQFKEFVDNGGYRKPEYWKHKFTKESQVLTWEEAMTEFRDATGRPGPSTWQAGDYPEGQDDFPVCGVSWYEAAAYAEFVGKSLPSVFHWEIATGKYNGSHTSFLSQTIRLSNFDGDGVAPVGSYQGISPSGAFDMAGNVREWCWNETPYGRFILGAAQNEVPYRYLETAQLSPINRSFKNGFRCVKYLDIDKIPEVVFKPLTTEKFRNYTQEKPVSEDVFQVYKNIYNYDSMNLDPVIEWTDDSSEDWIRERITFNAAYDNERMIAYLFLPKGIAKPYQTIVYFPGMGAKMETSSRNLQYGIRDFYDICDFIIKNGRALMYPVYLDTYERGDGMRTDGKRPYQVVEENIKQVKDFRRSIDYLETRSDIDTDRIAFYGLSWGGIMGIIISAVEERLKASILYSGGLYKGWKPLPEIDPFNFAQRIKIPILMLNGKYDSSFPMQKSQIPLYHLLGTSEKNKFHKTYEAGHFIPKNELIEEVLTFMDDYLGPVK
jgi:serine/threonine protein kinase/dienelactone hydrolase